MHSLRTYIIPFFALLILSMSSCINDKGDNSNSNIDAPIEEFEEVKERVKADVKTASSEKTTEKIPEKKPAEPAPEKAVFKKVVDKKTTPEKTQAKKKTTKKKTPKKKKRQAKIEFDEPNKVFGEIMEGDTVDFKFTFKNTGNAPLDIISAVPTCGCTRPSTPFLAIEPGEDGYIGVKYISVGKSGDQEPTITVTSNAYPETVVLTMKGFVKDRPKVEKKDIKEVLETVKDTIGG